MKKTLLISGLIIFIGMVCFFSLKHEKPAPEKAIQQTLVMQADSFTNIIKYQFEPAAENNDAGEKQLQQLFKQARLSFKRFEWAAEYYTPTVTRFVNGPPVPEVDQPGQIYEPAGLQVIENFLFPKYDKSKRKELVRQLKLLEIKSGSYTAYFKNEELYDWQVFDAAKQQVFRVMILGISGFDVPVLQNSMAESAASLQSLQTVMAYYENKQSSTNLTDKLNTAIKYLNAHRDFNSFDRAKFITSYANPVSTGIVNLEHQLKVPLVKYNRLLRQDAKTLFDPNAFNVNAYSSDISYYASDKNTELGKKLFSDPVLSLSETRSCRSCHQPSLAFTDGLVKNTVINSKLLLNRNTPTLINAAYQPSQFYDLRADMLEDQALDVMQNKNEMHGDMKVAATRLYTDVTYRKMFSNVFPQKNRNGISSYEIVNAISSYIRSIAILNSRFDDYMRGNKAAMDQQEIDGFNLFMGKAKCGTCHYMPLFNGTLPPKYMKIESEVIGVPATVAGLAIDTDMGRYNTLQTASFKHAFKIPTVRNAAQTAPYMHNGVFTTLQQVMDFYNKGGGTGLGYKVDDQTLPTDKLNLNKKESDDIIAFVKSLDNKPSTQQ